MPHLKPKTLYITLSFLMIALVALVYVVLTVHERSRSDGLMLQEAAAQARQLGREAAATVEAELRPVRVSVSLLAAGGLGRARTEAQRLAMLPELAATLDSSRAISSVYAGTTDGSLTLLRRLDDVAVRASLDAPPAARYALQSVDRSNGRVRSVYRFYDAALAELHQVERPEFDLDPRTRPWYALARQAAKGAGGVVVQSAPYRFFTEGEPGMSLAQARGDVVVGVDVGLRAIGELLRQPQIDPSAELLVATQDGALLAEARRELPAMAASGWQPLPNVAEAASPTMRALWQRRDVAGTLSPVQQVDGREWVAHALPLSGAADTGAALVLLMAAPRDELQAYQIESRRRGLFVSLGLMLLLLPLVHLLADRVSRPLRELARQAEAIQRFEFDGPAPRRCLLREVNRLATSMTAMKHSLRRFLDISGALSAERDVDALLQRILRETIAVTGAAGGALHLLSPDGSTLAPAHACRDDRPLPGVGRAWDVADADCAAVPVQALRADDAIEVDLDCQDPGHRTAHERLCALPDGPPLKLLAVPLKNREHEAIGTLTLWFPRPASPGHARHEPCSDARLAFVRALSGTAAVAIDNQLLLRTRKELMESFIKLVAGAVDAKSPYTAGHCQRVPELTRLIAQAACAATEGPYADFAMNAGEWEALHVASWLHDCGKVTTPEYVVDKATKLETLYNRIHEIRTRFEVLKRDVLIEALQAELGEPGSARARAAAAPAQAELDADFAFVAHANLGAESLRPEARERLKRIGARRWLRTLDDTLGISAEESRGKPRPRPPLPVSETLLQDRPDHIVRRPAQDVLRDGNVLGIRMKQPEHLYDRGELHNLSVSRGTLTEEERYKINEHVVQTLRMLQELPFPKHLRSVPEIAGGHHERMDGQGYPRGLKGHEMSPQARMMAVADVFEALTADDRPYKPGKRLSEALTIMQRMTRGGHLDAELFSLFLRSGSCLDYARRFMQPHAVDVSDVSLYQP